MNVHFLKHFPFKSFTLCVSYSRKTDFLMSTKNQLTQVVTTTTTATTCPELPVDFQVPLSILPITHRATAHRSVVREKSQTSDQHFFSRSKSSQEKKVMFPSQNTKNILTKLILNSNRKNDSELFAIVLVKVHKILLGSALFELFEIKIISPPKQEQNKET